MSRSRVEDKDRSRPIADIGAFHGHALSSQSLMYGLYRITWLNLAFGLAFLVGHEWGWAAAHIAIAAFFLPIGYRISAVFGIRIPWVKSDEA